MRVVVNANTLEKLRVAQFGAKHMQDPGAFLIVVGVQKFEKILGIGVVYRRAGVFLVVKVNICLVLHITLKVRFAFISLNEESGEIVGKAFAQPQIGPVGLSDRIAKPLMRDFMRDRISQAFTNLK